MILLSGRDLRELLKPTAVIEALRETYKALADSRSEQGRSLAFAIDGGSAHVKAGLLPGSRAALAAKINVNLPDNARQRGLPTIQGAVLLSDTISGTPLALMDSIALTGIRTAATAMLAASFGARHDAKVAAIIGCGAQAGYQVEALLASYAPDEVRLYDIEARQAEKMASELGLQSVKIASNAAEAASGSQICITCTTSKMPVLTGDMDLAGCFVAAMGADNPSKCEIEPALMRRARVLVDDIEQCASGGDLAHALKAGAITREQLHADLADLSSGLKTGRGGPDELVIFDSSGSGIQDVAAAWLAYQTARAAGVGTEFDLSG
jgi:ornithine cyclodeaminase/alanine dehydrogenase-like protein (mu-crystallin family)